MAVEFRPPVRPTWYRRVPPALQRVAAASDRVTSVPLASGSALREAVAALPAALATGLPEDVQAVAQRIGDGICTALRVPAVRVRVELRRPPTRRGELHGLYTPANGRARAVTRVRIIPTKPGPGVAYRTVPRALTHDV